MLDPGKFYDAIRERGIRFFTGVPDSTLKDFCGYVTDHTPPEANIITPNEGSAIALASGYYLATGQPALVYMQNSGVGNAINPITSLADFEVYGIPMLIIVGWRGAPGKKDEPQHVKMGKVMTDVLEAIDIEYTILTDSMEDAEAALDTALERAKARNMPYALVVKKGMFEKYKLKTELPVTYPLSREEAIERFIDAMEPGSPIISTTGKASRELFELREARGETHDNDFLTVGSMGHSSQIALGVALQKPNQTVYCLDGDGAVIMHMGGMANIANLAPKNYKHVVLNNGVHDSVGGQPTVAFDIDICTIAKASGYKDAFLATNRDELTEGLEKLHNAEGPALLEIRVKKGARADLGRPTISPGEQKKHFMGALKALQ